MNIANPALPKSHINVGHRRLRNVLALDRHRPAPRARVAINHAGAQPFGAEFGYTTARSGFAGWVRHWVERKDWFDACQ